MRKVVCVLAVLAVVGTAAAAQHWRGPGWGGDGTSWNDALNWDDAVPWDTSWDVNVTGEQGTPSNHVINVNQSGTVSSGTVAAQTGYSVAMTVLSDITLTTSSPNGLIWNGAGSLTIKPNATWDMRYGTFDLENAAFNTIIEDDGFLYCSTLRYNNNAKADVFGWLQAYTVNRIDAVLGSFNVRNGGLVQVDSGIPAAGIGWSKGGKITQYICSTVQLQGDRSGYYLQLVQAGEAGTWEVDYDVTKAGYTTIHLAPEPGTLVLMLLGLAATLRRR